MKKPVKKVIPPRQVFIQEYARGHTAADLHTAILIIGQCGLMAVVTVDGTDINLYAEERR